jgi:LPS sulfotransferase NodH
MKSTGRTLTLRGTSATFQATADYHTENILDYANVLDINKAWKIRWFEVWPVESLALSFPGSGYELALESILSTEDIVNIENRADDNRLIAWSNQSYMTGGKSAGSTSQGIIGQQIVVDPDHVIQKELNISFRVLGGTVFEDSDVNVNYIVYLEEVDITPTESIMFTIKQSAQSLNE